MSIANFSFNMPALVFYLSAALLLFSAVMVISARNPVRAVLFLVLSFFTSAVLWLLIQAEFLAFTLIIVYVGAVMVLFLFVVMMLDINVAELRERFNAILPLGGLLALIIVAELIYVLGPQAETFSDFSHLIFHPQNYSNIKALGEALFTRDLHPFILAGALLLVAIIAAIGLVYRGSRERKSQAISRQVQANPASRVRLVDLKEKKSP